MHRGCLFAAAPFAGPCQSEPVEGKCTLHLPCPALDYAASARFSSLARIFFTLALFAIALLATNIFLGFYIGNLQSAARDLVQARRDLNETKRDLTSNDEEVAALEAKLKLATKSYIPVRDRVRVHVLFGIAGTLVTILVNSITVTYFIGTTRWCREVVDTYCLDNSLTERSAALKRKAFPLAIVSFLAILTLVTLGAVSDPAGSNFEDSDRWVLAHQLAAWIATGIVAWSLMVQVGKIGANYEIIEEILEAVRQVRQSRGLDEFSENELSRFRM